MSNTPRGAPELVSAQAIPETTVNEQIRHTEAGASYFPVADRVTAPPGTCADGASYIVIATATGAFAGKEGQIATAVGTNASNGWDYHALGAIDEGALAYVQDEDATYLWSGTAWGSAPGGYTDEQARDAIGTALTAGSGISVTVNDGADTITIANTQTAYTDEMAMDAVAAMLTAGTGISVSYNDASNTFTITNTAPSAGTYSDENARDAIGAALVAGAEINIAVNDGADTITIKSTAKRVAQIMVTDPAGTAITTGDGQAYFRVPSAFDGMNLVSVSGTLITVSSSGIPTIQIANVTDSVDMLSTKLTIDASETDSATAATAAVIDTAHDDVATADLLRIDVDVAGTGAKGLIVTLTFQLP